MNERERERERERDAHTDKHKTDCGGGAEERERETYTLTNTKQTGGRGGAEERKRVGEEEKEVAKFYDNLSNQILSSQNERSRLKDLTTLRKRGKFFTPTTIPNPHESRDICSASQDADVCC